MKKWNMPATKSMVILCLLITMMLGTSLVYAHSAQLVSELPAMEERIVNETIYDAWLLAVRYSFEPIAENYDITQDSKMESIANLRGDDLRYFLDSREIINLVQTLTFPPSSPNSSNEMEAMTVAEQRSLVEMATNKVFFSRVETEGLSNLDELSRSFVLNLQSYLQALVEGEGDTLFTAQYLRHRTEIISFIENTGARLLDPNPQFLDSYLEYFDIEDKQEIHLDPGYMPESTCQTTNTIDNWPSKSSSFVGNTGSSWYEGKASDQNDCDIWVTYYMGPTLHYGKVSANTSAAQCVLDKTTQLRGDWTGSSVYFNNIQYGKITVTWWWPFGCNTTGDALRSATKWQP